MTSTRDVDPDDYEIVKSPPWARSDYYLRKKRDRVKDATKGELRARIAFGESATSTFGQEGLADDGLPPAASRVREDMAGESYSEQKRIVSAEELTLRLRIALLSRGLTFLEDPVDSLSSKVRRPMSKEGRP